MRPTKLMCIGQSLNNVEHDLPYCRLVDLSASISVGLDVLIQVAVAELCLDEHLEAWPLIGPSILDLSNVGMI